MREGLLIDFGGVLTTNVFTSFTAFCEAEGLEPEFVQRAFVEDPAAQQLLFDLELGKLDEVAFGDALGPVLGVAAEGLARRLFAGVEPDRTMLDAVLAVRRAGRRTGLISNSWGRDLYRDTELSELFDGLVISGDEGVRKPDPAIYALGAERIGLEPEQCVFVDDLGGNLKPARAMGMHTILHRSAEETIPELSRVLGVPIAAQSRRP